MGLFDKLKERMDDTMWDLKYGTPAEKAKILIKAPVIGINPLLYVGYKQTEKIVKNKINQEVNKKVHNMEIEMKTEYVAQIEKLKRVIEEMTPEQYYKFSLAGLALAIAAANIDNDFSKLEKEEIMPLLFGESYNEIPDNLKNISNALYDSPPSLAEALEYVKQVDVNKWIYFDNIIEMVIQIDGEVMVSEKLFFDEWMQFKASNGL